MIFAKACIQIPKQGGRILAEVFYFIVYVRVTLESKGYPYKGYRRRSIFPFSRVRSSSLASNAAISAASAATFAA